MFNDTVLLLLSFNNKHKYNVQSIKKNDISKLNLAMYNI